MSGDPPLGIYLYLLMILFVKVQAQDSLFHPELLSPQASEEFENEGNTKLHISFGEEIEFRTKAQFTYKGLEFNYQNEGGSSQKIKQTTSLCWSWKSYVTGSGKGQPHIAKGIILGNTMMRFSPSLSGQAGVRPSKFRIGAYDQYKELTLIGLNVRSVNINIFRFDEIHAGVVEYASGGLRAGLATYISDQFTMEVWGGYTDKKIKTCINTSVSGWKFNHILADILYKKENLSLFGSSVYLSKDFDGVKADSKWGSSLQPGSRGHAIGTSFSSSPWKASCIAYSIFGYQMNEKRCMLDIRFRKSPIELNFAYNFKMTIELKEDNKFPFALIEENESHHICKINAKIKPHRELEISYQIQGDILHPLSHVGVFRLTYKKKGHLLKFQISHCNGPDSDLYFLRPLSFSTYGIRKAPTEKINYLDLLYSKKIGDTEVYILLRNEGINVGITVKN